MKTPQSILAARVTSIRARVIGSALIILTVLVVAAILYSISLSQLNQALNVLTEAVAQSNTLSAEQQTTALEEADAARRALVEVPLAWGMLIALAALGSAVITLYSIVHPTERLTTAAGRLAAGNLEERVQVEWADEFGRLATAFNTMADQLQRSHASLEQQVAERTATLARRSAHLETAIDVAREAASIQDVDLLLNQAVTLISDRFGFYHAAIFLLDDAGERTKLRAASSEGGKRMLAREQERTLRQSGIVGEVINWGEPRILQDVKANASYFDNPDLPETRSEMALPLRARGKVIGVLDVHSKEKEAFTDEDVAILKTLTDQISIAISNASLFQQAQEGLEAERRAYGELSHQAWQQLQQAKPGLAQRYDPHGILSSDRTWRKEMKQAAQTGKPVLGESDSSAALTIPIKVRGKVVGVIDAHKAAGTGTWTDDEISLMEALIEQLSVALESARLYQDTQRRATQERLASEITARMHETLDVETVLKTTAQEVRQALGLPEVVVRLAPGAMEETGNGVEDEGA